MKILYDGQIFSFQEYGGISQYFYQLLKAFTNMDGISAELIIKYSNNSYFENLDDVQTRQFFPSHRFKGRNEIIKFLNRIYFKANFQDNGTSQIFHPTYYHPYFLRLINKTPFVLTIFDMAHEHYPKMFSPFDFTSTNKKKLIQKAKRIIAISENTKMDIIRLLQVPTSRIDVIPLATDISLSIAQKPSQPLPKDYIIYVGKRNTYKNFLFLVRAMKSISNSVSLVCAGGGKFSRNELIEINKLQMTDRVIQLNVNDKTLPYLYSKAQAFVFPSLYEGFGIPVLEAFACGCPALLSDRSSLPEVGGDAARFFNPEDKLSLSTAISEILDNKNLTNDMREKGYNRVKLFSWNNTAQKTLETYRKAISRSDN